MADLNGSGPIVVIDSREKRPWRFQLSTEVSKLNCGDYALKGYENDIAVERKSLDDLVMCLSWERQRFEAELARSLSYQRFFVLFEGNWKDIYNGNYRSEMKPRAVIGSITALSMRYDVQFWPVETRGLGSKLCQQILLRFYRDSIEGHILAKRKVL
jgi:ERCC4-type nuclease